MRSSENYTVGKYDEFKILDDEKTLVVKYSHAGDLFDLVYDKNKDKVLLMKNGKPVNYKLLRDDETERYKEFLDVAICYNHDRDGEYLN